MLQSIRDKTRGWIAYLIVFLISIPFALWGVNSYFGGGTLPPAATVDGQEITLQDLDTAYANYRRRLSQMFGGSIPEALGNESLLKEQVLGQMIEEFALRSYAERNDYRIGDSRLNQLIRSMEPFQTDNQFDGAVYQRQLASQGYSPAGFEAELRRTQAMQQFRTGITATAFNTPGAYHKKSQLSNQTRTIRYITRPLNTEVFEVSEEEISEHFEKHQARYMTEEQVKVDYIDLSLDEIKATIEVDLASLQDRYERNLDAYTSTEIRSASHILISLSADATDSESEQAEQNLIDLREQIESGADFAELARVYSQDPVSAEEGGDLGEIERGMMVQPFEVALFDLAVGEVSQPIKTSFGWHLIKLNSVSGGETRSFDEARDDIENEIKTELAESQIYDLSENLANLAYEQPDSLLPAAEQLGLGLQTSDWFDRISGNGIASEAKVRSIAFSAEVLNQGLNSEAIELADNRIVFIHLNEHRPSAPKSLDEVRNDIIAEIKSSKSREENSEKGKAALEALKQGSSLSSIAEEWEVEIPEPSVIRRDNAEINSEIVKLAFTMPRPQPDPVYQGISHGNGSYSLVELQAVNSGESTVNPEQMRSLQTAIANQEYQSVIKVVRNRADVVRTPLEELDY